MIDAAPLVLEQLSRGQRVWLVARGGSMRPVLRDGDRLCLDPEVGPAPVGAVVLWVTGGVWRVHRVTARLGVYRQLAGDALPQADGWVHVGLLSARVVEARRGDRAVPLGGRGVVVASRLARRALRRLPWIRPLARAALYRRG